MDIARKLLTKLRRFPKPTPAKLLGEFRRLVAAKRRGPSVANRTDGHRACS